MLALRPLSVALHGYENDAGGRVKVGELLRLLAEDGWQLARTRGSHRQYKHPVAGKPSLDVPPGTLNAILKQAETREEVLQLIREAIELHIDGLKEDGLPVPTPSSEGEFVEVGAA